MARCPWAEISRPPGQCQRPSRCACGRSASRVAAPHRPAVMLSVWSGSSPGSDARHEGSSNHPHAWAGPLRGHREASPLGGRRREPTSRVTDPQKRLALCGDVPSPRGTPTNLPLLLQHPFFRARLRTQVSGDGLCGRAGASHGLVMPVPGDFTAALQKNGSDLIRH